MPPHILLNVYLVDNHVGNLTLIGFAIAILMSNTGKHAHFKMYFQRYTLINFDNILTIFTTLNYDQTQMIS